MQSSVPKVFENLILRKICSCEKCNILPFQHGFLSGRPTLTTLHSMKTSSQVPSFFAYIQKVDSIYEDFIKAFE